MKVTEYLAIYGALLSTAVFLWNASRASSKIRVRLCFALDKDEDGKPCTGIGISVQNPSAHAVHITHIGLLYPWRAVTLWDRVKHVIKYRSSPARMGWCHTSLSNYGKEDGCPISIEPGQSHYVFVEQSTIESVLETARSRFLIAQVQDALWRNKCSRTFAVDVPPSETPSS